MGVNVYVAVAVLLTVVGDHVPVIPFVEVEGNTGAAEPLQIGATGVNVGVILDTTVTVMFVVVAHWPASGVNVYVPVVVLLTVAGDQVPVMPFVDDIASTGARDPLHNGPIGANTGIMPLDVTVTLSIVPIAHCPGSGVNV